MNDDKQYVTREHFEKTIGSMSEEIEKLRMTTDLLTSFISELIKPIEKCGHLSAYSALERPFEEHVLSYGKVCGEAVKFIGSMTLHASPNKNSYLYGLLPNHEELRKKVSQILAPGQTETDRPPRKKK